MRYMKVRTLHNILKRTCAYFPLLKTYKVNLNYELFIFCTKKQCVIAEENEGIMVLLKRNFLINMIHDYREQKVKVTIRFFNIDGSVIHTTDRTEIEIDDEVLTQLQIVILFICI